MPPAKRTKLEDVTENVNNAYASQDEVKERNLCTLFEKDGNFFRFSSSVHGGAEQIFVLQATVVFVFQFHLLTCLPGPSKAAV